jgi:CRP/FNR family transcriptional regulator, cyclic AMP receptor protein
MPTKAKGPSPAAQLKGIQLFSNLSDAALADIARHGQLRTYARHEHILLEGDRCEAAYFVVSGEVHIYRVSPEGREQVLVRLTSGQAFNTVPQFEEEGRNPSSAAALTRSTVLILRSEDFLRLTRAHPDLSLAMFRDFAKRLGHLTNLVESLGLYSVQERLIRFLLDQADQDTARASQTSEGATGGSSPPVIQRWTQQDIAVHLGTVRDVIGRSLRALEDDTLIRVDRGKIVLLDRSRLERLAGRD